VYLPEDSAIPAPEVKAEPQFTRTFVDETEILQRELKDDGDNLVNGKTLFVQECSSCHTYSPTSTCSSIRSTSSGR
jgi:mono/diheme cytochrome c family protein